MDLYKILDLNISCTQEEIKNSYKKLALKWHPDRNLDKLEEANRKFKDITNAYSILSDTDKKKDYDLNGKIEEFTENPIELFNYLFKDINPKIKNLLKKTYDNVDKIKKENKDIGIVNIIKNIDKETKIDILNEGINLLNQFLNDKNNNL